jgi:hypothetical protein
LETRGFRRFCRGEGTRHISMRLAAPTVLAWHISTPPLTLPSTKRFDDS